MSRPQGTPAYRLPRATQAEVMRLRQRVHEIQRRADQAESRAIKAERKAQKAAGSSQVSNVRMIHCAGCHCYSKPSVIERFAV